MYSSWMHHFSHVKRNIRQRPCCSWGTGCPGLETRCRSRAIHRLQDPVKVSVVHVGPNLPVSAIGPGGGRAGDRRAVSHRLSDCSTAGPSRQFVIASAKLDRTFRCCPHLKPRVVSAVGHSFEGSDLMSPRAWRGHHYDEHRSLRRLVRRSPRASDNMIDHY
jgi:hypothetical protein